MRGELFAPMAVVCLMGKLYFLLGVWPWGTGMTWGMMVTDMHTIMGVQILVIVLRLCSFLREGVVKMIVLFSLFVY